MAQFQLMRGLRIWASTNIVHRAMDGLGGLPRESDGLTELEAAHTPNLDALAAHSQLGLAVPVAHGITPGSGPAHLSLFGYDPLVYDIGRGVLEALGIDFDLQPEDVAARGNFCTVDDEGLITDRRAGRIATEVSRKLVALLREIELPGVRTFVEAVKEYRFVLVLRPTEGQTLHANIADTDPQRLGVPPLMAEAQDEASQETAALVNRWIAAAREILADHSPANCLNLRGLAKDPGLPKFPEIFGLHAAAIAAYPMYRGVARLVGMDVVTLPGEALEDELHARLFDRTTRSIRITEEGSTFLLHVERILAEIEAARASVDDKVTKPKGKLKLAAPACLGRREGQEGRIRAVIGGEGPGP